MAIGTMSHTDSGLTTSVVEMCETWTPAKTASLERLLQFYIYNAETHLLVRPKVNTKRTPRFS